MDSGNDRMRILYEIATAPEDAPDGLVKGPSNNSRVTKDAAKRVLGLYEQSNSMEVRQRIANTSHFGAVLTFARRMIPATVWNGNPPTLLHSTPVPLGTGV